MGTINTSYTPGNPLDIGGMHDELQDIKKEAHKSLQDYLIKLGTILSQSNTVLGSAPILAPPSQSIIGLADQTLRIALIQDALNQLLQQVSELEIDGRLNTLEQSNMDELKNVMKQIDEAQEAHRKQTEANQKAGVFEAVGAWFKAVFDVVSAAFSAVAAIGYALTGNVVAAAGLFVAAAALLASGVCNIVLAVDATVRAAGGQGFLSETHKANLEKAAEICGYIAMAAGMLGGLAAVTGALRSAVSTASKEMVNYGLKTGFKEMSKQVLQTAKDTVKNTLKEAFTKATGNAFKTATKEVTKEVAEEAAQQAIRIAIRSGGQEAAEVAAKQAVNEFIQATIKEAIQQSLKPLTQMISRMGLLTTISQAAMQGTSATGTLLVGNIEAEVQAHKLEADKAEAAAKAFQGLIVMLRNLIEQLQKELLEMIESSMESVQALFTAVDETLSSMKDLMQMKTH